PQADSEAQTFTWHIAATNVLTVPWPARPLPPLTHFDDDNGGTNYRVAAMILRDTTNNLDVRYPVGIRIGNLSLMGSSYMRDFGLNVGTTNFFYFLWQYQIGGSYWQDPQKFVFTRNSADSSRNGDSLLPLVVYRLQVTNSSFPKVSGNLVQVTPLIERIPWKHDYYYAYIPDLLLAAGAMPWPINTTYAPPLLARSYLCVRDQQPVMVGASYHYYAVRFNAKHEVAETIDSGIVTIPPN
ncbi:MAG: hypothetical protein WCH61_09705, partial [bacterium]